MGLLSYVGKVYDLDTLDTRFTTKSSVPYQTVIDARTDPDLKKEAAHKSRGQPSKWKTNEFSLYFVILAFAIPYMFWVVYSVSRRALALSVDGL